MALYVYILKCADGTFYTGLTDDPKRRLEEHQQGIRKKAYTYRRRPVELVYSMHFPDGTHDQARAWEKKLKGWSTAKKLAVIEDRWTDLPKLSECRNDSRSTKRSANAPDPQAE